MPSIVFWFATERCDVGCKHCCYPPKNSNELDTDEAKDLISRVAEFGADYFGFIGGEPLLRDDIKVLAEWCGKLGMKPYVVTKGGKLAERGSDAEKLASGLKKAGAKITVAIDGITHSTIDAICGIPDVYERIKRVLDMSLKHEILQGFVTAALKPNLMEICSVLDYGSRIGVSRCSIFGIRPTGRGKSTFSNFAPSPREFEDFMRGVAREIKGRRWKQEVFIYDPLFVRILREEFRGIIPWYDYVKICRIGEYMNLDSEGRLMPCLFSELRFGNALERPLGEIYADMKEKTAKLRNPNFLNGKCGHCEYNRVCGGCRVRAYGLTGDWLGPDPLCNYVPQKSSKEEF